MPSTTASEEKAALRRWVRSQPPQDHSPLETLFPALPQVAAARTVLLFYGVGREPDTRNLLVHLLNMGKRVALPRCLPGGEMEARAVTALEELEEGAYGIPAPPAGAPLVPREEVDVILVPNLCCDREGYRLGRGGGYYDRYLAGYTGTTVAWCPPALLVPRVPREEHDVPVDLLLTV